MAALRKAIEETRRQQVRARAPEISIAAKVDAYFKEDREVARGWESILDRENEAYSAVPRPACLFYERVSQTTGERYLQAIISRDCIETRRKVEISQFGYYWTDTDRLCTGLSCPPNVEEMREAHLHGVACRYRERLAALERYNAEHKAARIANGCEPIARELKRRDRALGMSQRSIYRQPAQNYADLCAKAEMIRYFAKDWFKQSPDPEYCLLRSLVSDLRRLAEGEGDKSGSISGNVVSLSR